jgi:HK97 family phage portal protein
VQFNLFGKKFEIKMSGTGALPATSNDTVWSNYLKGLGYSVSRENALKIAVVLRCADVVAKTIASLGCHLYKKTAEGRERAESHPLYKLLRYQPNRETSAYDFWHMYVINLMLSKGAYAKIVRDQNGFIKELWNIPSNRVVMDRNPITKERYIDVTYSSNSYSGLLGERIYEGNFMYTPGIRFCDEENPEDFMKIASEVLQLTGDLNTYAKDYFENGSNLGGFISYPTGVDETAFNKFKEDWKKAYEGVMNMHKWAILEGGFTATKMDSNPEQAQALESRKFQVVEICRLMGVPPNKVFSLDNVSYNSIEQLNIEYWQDCIDPMDERLCQTIFKDLLTTLEQKKHYAKFNINKLLRGDTTTRTTYYTSMRQNGVFSTNDIRELEDLNSIPDEEGGNVRLVNGNLIPLTVAKNNLPKAMQKGSGSN